jgi:hypothetical protein
MPIHGNCRPGAARRSGGAVRRSGTTVDGRRQAGEEHLEVDGLDKLVPRVRREQDGGDFPFEGGQPLAQQPPQRKRGGVEVAENCLDGPTAGELVDRPLDTSEPAVPQNRLVIFTGWRDAARTGCRAEET